MKLKNYIIPPSNQGRHFKKPKMGFHNNMLKLRIESEEAEEICGKTALLPLLYHVFTIIIDKTPEKDKHGAIKWEI